MSVIYNQNFCQPFYNGYRPLNVMRNGRKIAGWSKKSKAGDSEGLFLTGTYDDYIEYQLHGRTVVEGAPHIGEFKQHCSNSWPSSARINDISRRGYGTLVFKQEFQGLQVICDENNMCRWRMFNLLPIENKHKYLIAIFTSLALSTNATLKATFNTGTENLVNCPDATMRYNCYAKVWDSGTVNTDYDNVTYTYNGPSGDYLYINRFMIVDLTRLWGADNVQAITYYNNNPAILQQAVRDVLEVDPYLIEYPSESAPSEAYTSYDVNDISIPYLRSISPQTPATIKPDDYIWLQTDDNVSEYNYFIRDDLHVWDTLIYSDFGNRILSYGAKKTIGELNWSTNGDSIFITNGSDYLYRTEYVYLDYYPQALDQASLDTMDYGYFVGSNKVLYIKDHDFTDASTFKSSRADGSILYYSATSVSKEASNITKLVTYPYSTHVLGNSSFTISYKKWDNSAND